MHEPERITVGLDDTEASWTALRWAAARAAEHPCRIRVVHVVDLTEPDVAWPWHRLTAARSLVEDTAPGTAVELEPHHGSVSRVLAAAAADDDLVVVGSHRRRRLQSALTGLLPDRIAGQAIVPVVIVPDDWSGSTSGDVVLGVASHTATNAIAFAAAEASRRGVALHLVHAWRVPTPVGPAAVAIMQENPEVYEQSARLVLDAVVARVIAVSPGLEVVEHLANAATAAAVGTVARDRALVVVGRHHRTTVGGEFLGSTAQELVAATATPLCVVPERIA